MTLQLSVEAGIFPRTDCLVRVDLSDYIKKSDEPVQLIPTGEAKPKAVPCQLVKDGDRIVLLFVADGKIEVGQSRNYTLESKKGAGGKTMTATDADGAVTLKKGGRRVINYVHKITMPPAGADPAYQRGGYIHPAYSPSGNVLTTIQPKDHYHHYGIWNPWTHLEYKGKVHDLWNLKDKQGTVRHEKVTELVSGPVVSGFKAIHNNIVFNNGTETNVMNEEWDVRAYNTPGTALMWDFKSTQTPIVDESLFVRAYRYGGFGYRACEEWTNKNSIMISSEGKSRQQIDGSNGRWIYTEGVCKNGTKSGVLFMGFPQNRKYPEPFRIWDEKANGGRGDVFVNFAPTKVDDWELKPHTPHVLRYRVVAYDGEMTPERAETLWQDFAYPPYVAIR